MSFTLSAGAAVMLALCFPGGPSEVPSDGQCTVTLNDKELAGSVSNRKSVAPVLTRRIAVTQGHDQLRMTGGASIAADRLVAELEQQAVADSIHSPVPSAPSGSLFAPEQTIISSPGGTATINADFRVGGEP